MVGGVFRLHERVRLTVDVTFDASERWRPCASSRERDAVYIQYYSVFCILYSVFYIQYSEELRVCYCVGVIRIAWYLYAARTLHITSWSVVGCHGAFTCIILLGDTYL